MSATIEDRSAIAFFDVETTVPTRSDQGRAILEFGAILVCPKTLEEVLYYSTPVRPTDLSRIASLSDRPNGITKDAVVNAPTFADIADDVYDLLHGRIWAGHNILGFDCARIREAYSEINRRAPEPRGTIDSLGLLKQKFGRRAGNMKMATLATYFRLGPQTHRSLDDVRMNLKVLKYCATVLFMESNICDFLTPDHDNLVASISVTLAPFYRGTKIDILHQNIPLQLQCEHLTVRCGIRPKFVDHAGRPRLNIVVNATPDMCKILDRADYLAQKLSSDSGSLSEWRPAVTRKEGNFPSVRLNLPTGLDGEITRLETEIYQKDNSATRRLESSRFDVTELDLLFTPGNLVDAYFSLDTYDYMRSAGIRLVAKKLIVHSS